MKYYKSNKVILFLLFSVFLINYSKAQNENLIELNFTQNTLNESYSIPIQFQGKTLNLELTKNHVFGKNTQFLVDDGSGNLVEVEKGEERTYSGHVIENSNYNVNAVLTENGLVASIFRPGQSMIEIRPNSSGKRSHKIFTTKNKVFSASKNCSLSNMHKANKNLEHTTSHSSLISSDLETIDQDKSKVLNELSAQTSSLRTTLRPTTVMEVREFEVAVEIGSRAFFASSAYNGNLATAQASAQSIIGNLNARFLRGAGVKHTLGKVIIRTNVNTDPLRNSVTGTGVSSTAGSSLAAFRDYWNNNPNIVGNTHDLAVYHVLGSPSGLAYVNSVGSTNKYATMGGNGATSWANGTAAHEVGHSWSLAHNNVSGLFYEARPRNNSGSNSSGGDNFFVSIMNGSGRHNIGRLSTTEAKRVIAARKAKSGVGTLVRNPQPIPPFGVFDRVTINSSTSAGVFDVIANDYDANNDVLDVRLLDNVSNKGGRLSLSTGTGPGGRNQIRYTPPASGLSGEDFFHYTVFDTSGRKDFGAVYVKALASTVINVNLNATAYNYDLGTPNSPVQNGWTRISERTTGDVKWSGAVSSRDRGASSGVNNINRDLIQSSVKRVLRHKIKNGVWSVIMNLGDSRNRHDNMSVKAEGRTIANNVTSQVNEFVYINSDNVQVRDGELNIEISDNGGTDANWVWTRLSLKRIGDLPTPPVVVNTNATSYDYDLGTPTSPVQNGWKRISNKTNGDISWSGSVDSRDRGASSGINNINRDFIQSSSKRVLRHKIKNGVWNVVINMGDSNFRHDNMSVKAEGRSIGFNINSGANQFAYVLGERVEVRDGVLNIEIADNGGSDQNWVWNRLSLKRVGNLSSTPPSNVNINATSYNYDLGTSSSLVQAGWKRISDKTNGDISWSGTVTSRDRGTSPGINSVNRDLVQGNSKRVLRHLIKNGRWDITINLGDSKFPHDNMGIKIEGKVITRSVSNQAGKFPYVRANAIQVRDGVLDIEITDNGGRDANWVWTRLSIKRVGNLRTAAVSNNSNISSLENDKTIEEVKIYPNPVNDVLNLSYDKLTTKIKSITIYNNIGRELRTLKLSSEYPTIDVSELPSGIYYLIIRDSNEKIIKNEPFVKK